MIVYQVCRHCTRVIRARLGSVWLPAIPLHWVHDETERAECIGIVAEPGGPVPGFRPTPPGLPR